MGPKLLEQDARRCSTSRRKSDRRTQVQILNTTIGVSIFWCTHVVHREGRTAIHMHPAPLMSQHHTAEALPPASKGNERVVAIVENVPLMLTANEKAAKRPNSRLKTGLYPNSAARAWSASLRSPTATLFVRPRWSRISITPTLDFLWRIASGESSVWADMIAASGYRLALSDMMLALWELSGASGFWFVQMLLVAPMRQWRFQRLATEYVAIAVLLLE